MRVAVLILGVLLAGSSQANNQVELILDASGSMYNKVEDGRFRITAAKEVMAQFIEGLPNDGLDVGLRIYGSQIKPGEPGACQDSKLFVPINGVDKPALAAAVKNTLALGSTPIAYSLRLAADDFGDAVEQASIILVTDGKEVCDGDVRGTLAALKERGLNVDLRIIGFDLSDDAIASFQGIGRFENATDAKALAQALGRAVQDLVEEADPLADASLDAADVVSGGRAFEVSWQADNGPSDYVTIVKPDARDGAYGSYSYVNRGNPVTLIAPIEPGEYELRYQSDRTPGVSARRAIEVIESEVIIQAPRQITAGTPFNFSWVGPNGPADYLTIVEKNADDGVYTGYVYTNRGAELSLVAPIKQGDYEIRYQSERGGVGVIGRFPVEVLEVEIRMDAPAKVAAGKPFGIDWVGPNGPSDYITVVTADRPDGQYGAYVYTSKGSTVSLVAPIESGSHELRYQSDRVGGVFARKPIEVLPLEINLDAVDSASAGTQIEISWEGPGDYQDYLTIVKADAAPGTYAAYVYVRQGPTLQMNVPSEPGQYEIRYQSDRVGGVVFAARPLEVKAAD